MRTINRPGLPLCVLLWSLSLGACAVTDGDSPLAPRLGESPGDEQAIPPGSDLAGFLEAGGSLVTTEQYARIIPGNTKVGDGWVIYFAPDGRKLVETADGERVERSWRIDETGAVCEELVSSGAEVCDSDIGLYELKGVYRAFFPDGRATPIDFVILEGEVGLDAAERFSNAAG